MFKISIKAFLTIIISKLIIFLSKKLFKGGSNFPGRVALKLEKDILKFVSNDYETILITGTNGKTTTTSMIYNIIKNQGNNVLTNATGANMLPGIISCYIDNYKFKKSPDTKYAVIEVDEANLKLVTKFITPKIIAVTNVFRDQLDRYGEVYTTLYKILEGIEKVPTATLILNGDESLLGDLPIPNKVMYYGFDCAIDENTKIDVNADAKFCKKCKTPYKYNYIIYNHLGSFYCEKCGYKRNELNYVVDNVIDLSPSGSLVCMDGKEFYINQPGIYNIYNALCAYSVAKSINIEDKIIQECLKKQDSSFGRQESIKVQDKSVKIILVKNPAGFDQSLNTIMLDKESMNIAFLLNDNYADGRDVSWIWDVKFEILKDLNINKIMVSGTRMYDMATRLKVAGLDTDKFALCQNYDVLLESIITCDDSTVYILATYTAMISFRKFLFNKGYIDKLW